MGKVTLRWGSVFIQTSFQHVSVYGILISVISKDDKDTKSTYAFQKITFVPVRVIVLFVELYVTVTRSGLRKPVGSLVILFCV